MPFRALIHESGHALAMKLLYQNKPQIVLHQWGYGGAECQIRAVESSSKGEIQNAYLSSVGKLIGRSSAECAFAAAGPLVDVISHVGTLIATGSRKIALLTLPASISFSLYALSALWPRNTSESLHDFVTIWEKGGLLTYIGAAAACFASTSFVAYKALAGIDRESSSRKKI